MDMFELVGKRLTVTGKNGAPDLGLGTYLWNGEILLDTGKKIKDSDCLWKVTTESKVPPFSIKLLEPARVFNGERHRLLNTGLVANARDEISIQKIEVCGWNHGRYVAGRFTHNGTPYWLLMSEVELPFEKPPFLRAVA